MAGWFAKLMQRGRARGRLVIAWRGVAHDAGPTASDARDARYDAIVRMLRDREADDRVAREKRQRFWYKQSLESDSRSGGSTSTTQAPVRLHRFRTSVPCRTTPEARALLDGLRRQFPGSTVSFAQLTNGQQAVMLAGGTGRKPRQIGWIEQCVQTDPKRCRVTDQGLAAETDGGALVLRFRYPPTTVRMFLKDDARDETSPVSFTEIRSALDPRPTDKSSTPGLVWITRPELEMLDAFRSRDYEAFYVRFKLSLLTGIWSSLSCLLSSLPGALWHEGSHYTVVREPDGSQGRINQTTVDDSGRATDIGSDRVYDAFYATDILLLYLDGDILADIADVYFTLLSLSSADAYFVKEEFFTIIRRFWATSQSLASRYGGDLATVLRMSQRAVPMPAQAALLKQDWTNLRQSLVDRYGLGGRKAVDLIGDDVHRPRTGSVGWPFESVPAGELNMGLRLVYRQEPRLPGGQKIEDGEGDVVKATVEPTIVNRLGDLTADDSRTLPDEVENVVLVAEKLPMPAEINLAWVRRHDWILAKVLLDESFRDALNTIGQDPAEEQLELLARDLDLNLKRDRLYKHLRDNILHYQRAIWQQEDPQQRSMRYRKSGKKVPLEWRFELETGAALTIDELCDRLSATHVDGQFAAYSGGREADLDEVIDPSPIGYYGNYCIYRMRPEFGGGDLFSMLHFFKSPYLRITPKIVEPEVEDAETKSDVVREGESASEREQGGGIDLPEAPDGLQVLLEDGRGSAHLITNGHDLADTEWTVRRRDADCIPSEFAGTGIDLHRWNAGEFTLRQTGSLHVRASGMRCETATGRAHDRETERILLARAEGKPPLLVGAGETTVHKPASERVILARANGKLAPGVVAGAGSALVQERFIVVRDDQGLRPIPIAG
ncbi:MAG TPA: hypothetical protein VFT29_19010 [Gemmatimonadaceae bacterium]|nr:hypothetical protein [Gemmatimonadaceae bacterium]